MEINKTLPAPYALAILVVDDHPVFRHGLVEILSEVHFVKRVEEACDGDEAMKLIAKKKFDIILLDIEMPGKNGLDFLAELKLKAMLNQPKVIIVSSHSTASKVLAAYELGVFGYIMKDTPVKEIRKALLLVAEGEPYFSDNIRKIMLDQLVRNRPESPDSIKLTIKERQVLDLVCKQLSNKEIADLMFLSEKTIKRHRSTLNEKVGAKNAAGLIVYAIQNGLFRV